MRIVLVILVLLVAALAVLVPWLEPRLVFFPTSGEDDTTSRRGLRARVIESRTADGEALVAWWLPHPRARADIIYFHGNGGNLSIWLDVLAALQTRGFNVFGFDYRGYGRSSGTPSEQGLLRDTDAIIETYQSQLASADRQVIYWGRSLGSVFAAYATTRRTPAGLVLESAFPDKSSMVRHDAVFRALNLFSRYQLSVVDWLRGWQGPTLVLHGDRDSVVPFALGQEVFAAVHGDKRFGRLSGADHNDAFGTNAREYWATVDAFVARVTGYAPSP